MAIATQISLVFLYLIFLNLNIIIEKNYDCRDPALISYYPDQQVKRLKQEEFMSAFGVRTKKEIFDLYHEFGEAGNIYEPFVETAHKPMIGRYYGITENGFRMTSKESPWPPKKSCRNIFFFGGSTCWHTGPWWTGIPTAFKVELEHSENKNDEVYNFGRSSYFSTQERILYEQIILNGNKPNIAIFIDGLNDLQITSGVPQASSFIASLYNQAVSDNQQKYLLGHNHIMLDKMKDALRWSAPAVFFSNLKNVISKPSYQDSFALTPVSPDLSLARQEQELSVAIERMIQNWEMIDKISHEKGTIAIFVIQPVPVYGYNLKYHRFVPRAWPASLANVAAGYPMLKKKCAEKKGLKILDLSDMQSDSTENLYVDSCHYTAEFAKKIASRIYRFVQEQKYLQ